MQIDVSNYTRKFKLKYNYFRDLILDEEVHRMFQYSL
jgi:hypothetical protein